MPTGRLGLTIYYTGALTLKPVNFHLLIEVTTSETSVVCGLCSWVSLAMANISAFRKVRK